MIISWQSATYMHASSGNQCQIRLDSTKKLSNIREILFNSPKILLKKLSRILLLIYINRILSLLSRINTLSLVLVFFFNSFRLPPKNAHFAHSMSSKPIIEQASPWVLHFLGEEPLFFKLTAQKNWFSSKTLILSLVITF